jgi:hypothetical protein
LLLKIFCKTSHFQPPAQAPHPLFPQTPPPVVRTALLPYKPPRPPLFLPRPSLFNFIHIEPPNVENLSSLDKKLTFFNN